MAAYDANQTLIDQLLHLFKFSPNILKLLEILANGFQDTIDAAEFILSSVTLDDYEGQQLDFWGELVGVKRPRAQEPNIFTLCALGEAGDVDNNTGFLDDTDTVLTGGYMTSLEGCPCQADPNLNMSDVDYRFLIKQKAQSFRSRMTHANLYKYLLAFGARCKIDGDSDVFQSVIEMQAYNDLSEWQKNYVVERGFAPASLTIRFDGNLRKDIL